MKINKKLIEELAGYLKELNLSEIEYGEKDIKVKVSRNIKEINTSPNLPVENKKKNDDIESGFKVSSPIVGTAYLSPEPGGKKFVEVGQNIKKGQTIMIIEAMKTMNHVPSSRDGVVKKVLVEDGQPVEFGQALILLN